MRTVVAGSVVVVLLIGCGDDDEASTASVTTDPITPTVERVDTTTPSETTEQTDITIVGTTEGPTTSDDPTTTEAATTPPDPPTTAAPPASATTRCIAVDQAKLDDIAVGWTGDGDIAMSNGYAVKSEDYDNVFMIAARMNAPGTNGQTGVWASNRLEPLSGLLFSVDAFAVEFTDWGVGADTDAEITIERDGVDEARACAEAD